MFTKLEVSLCYKNLKQYSTYPHAHTQDGRLDVRSPSPNPSSSLPSTFHHKTLFDDDLESLERSRVSSVSGRPVRKEGVALVIGEDSSSESEDENEENGL